MVRDDTSQPGLHRDTTGGAVTGRRNTRSRSTTGYRARTVENYNPLTRLPNADLTRELLDLSIQRMQGNDRFAGVLLLDIEGFRSFAATAGKYEADLLLCRLARRLLACTNEQVVLGHNGRHEFALVIGAPNPPESLMPALLSRIWSALHPTVSLLEGSMNFGFSVGSAFSPADGRTAESLIVHARSRLHHFQVREHIILSRI